MYHNMSQSTLIYMAHVLDGRDHRILLAKLRNTYIVCIIIYIPMLYMGILKLTAVSVFTCCVCSNGCRGAVKTLMNAPI